MKPTIIATGSSGNATFINEHGILIDCGVPASMLADNFKQIRLVLLTHRHSDHFNARTILSLHKKRPTVRFACGAFLVPQLVELGISPRNIDMMRENKIYDYGAFVVSPIALVHNVPNFGYRICSLDGEKLIYATDTGKLDGIEAKNYDYYLIEANHGEDEIRERMKLKTMSGEYAYEHSAVKYHLSREKADDWLAENAGNGGVIYYMHEHKNTKEE